MPGLELEQPVGQFLHLVMRNYIHSELQLPPRMKYIHPFTIQAYPMVHGKKWHNLQKSHIDAHELQAFFEK